MFCLGTGTNFCMRTGSSHVYKYEPGHDFSKNVKAVNQILNDRKRTSHWRLTRLKKISHLDADKCARAPPAQLLTLVKY